MTHFIITQHMPDPKLLQEIEKRTMHLFINLGMNTSNWTVMSCEQLFDYSARKRFWIAMKDDKPVGFAAADQYGEYAHAEKIDVDPDYQRQGMGFGLAQARIEWARSLELKAITLRTFTTTPWSQKLDAKLGFKVTTEELPHMASRIAYEKKIGLLQEDRVTMILRLNSKPTTLKR